MLVGMMVWTAELASEGFEGSVLARVPEIDVGAGLVVLVAGAADTILVCKLQKGLPILHVLCYTLAHGGAASFALVLCRNFMIAYPAASFYSFLPTLSMMYCSPTPITPRRVRLGWRHGGS